MQLFRTGRALTASWDLVSPSIRLVQENIWPVFYLSFLPGLIGAVGLVLANDVITHSQAVSTMDGRASLGIALAVIGGLWSLVTYPGLLLLQLKAIAGEKPSAMACFTQGLRRLLPFIVMSILMAVLIILGILALIVPGLILVRSFYLAQYYIVDQNISPIEALKKSFADSKPNAGYIWGIIGVAVVFGAMSSALGQLPVIGSIMGLVISMIYLFGPALRYGEIVKKLPVRLG